MGSRVRCSVLQNDITWAKACQRRNSCTEKLEVRKTGNEETRTLSLLTLDLPNLIMFLCDIYRREVLTRITPLMSKEGVHH